MQTVMDDWTVSASSLEPQEILVIHNEADGYFQQIAHEMRVANLFATNLE